MKMFLALTIGALAWGGTPVQRAQKRAAVLVNPLTGNERAVHAGAKLYERECAECHGGHGEGHGKALPLVSSEVHEASPGTLLWVITNGSLRRGMPSFAHLPERARWQVVAYLQSLR